MWFIESANSLPCVRVLFLHITEVDYSLLRSSQSNYLQMLEWLRALEPDETLPQHIKC